ncbi:FUSC family protein [Comamonas antarctica]|uniref:FUSC family protein n=1 Tax=Comamonas antarctica TaxID=2743470 RepID=UPI0028F006E8|nr:FUSC family protein [Comamonas antarctica]
MAMPAAESLTAPPAPVADARGLLQLLRPAPGRLEFALRLALVCTLSVGVAEWFQTPEVALTAYVGFFLLRADRTTSIVLSVGMLVLASALIGLVALMANFLIGRPAALLASMTLIAAALFFLASASKLAPVGGIVALIVTFALSLIALVPVGELATRALLYAWLMVAIPAGVCVAVNLLAAPAPRRLAERALALRLEAAAAVLRSGKAADRAEMQRLRAQGPQEILGWLRLAALEKRYPATDIAALEHACHATARVLVLAEVLDAALTDPAARSAIAGTLDDMARILARGGYPVEISLPDIPQAALAPPAAQALARLRRTLAHFADEAEPAPSDPDPAPGFFAHDAFSNPLHVRFALKATGAAMFCYLFYNALGWQGIHTAFITCFVVALGTTAETVQKLSLRIAGCLVGAALGVAALLWVLPALDGLAGLLALCFIVTLGATWIAVGSSRIAYAGFQIAFAFYLCVLQGNGPTYDLGVASNRVIGILLGNLVVYLVFTRVWPVSVAQRIDTALAALLRHLARVAKAPETALAAAQLGKAQAAQGAIADDLALLAYEPPQVRPGADWIAQRQRTLQCANALVAPLMLQPGDAALAATLDGLSRQIDAASPPAPTAATALPPALARPVSALAEAVQEQTHAAR